MLALAAFLSACIARYGDVDDDSFGHPQPLTVFVGVVVAVAVGTALASIWFERVARMVTGLSTAVLGAAATTLVLLATGKQSFPRAGGLWLLLSAIDAVPLGLLIALGQSDTRSASRRRQALSALGAGLVLAGGLVAVTGGPGWWRLHNADRSTATTAPAGAYPTSFSTVAWRHPLGTGEEYAGTYGGRVLVAVTDLRTCRSGVRALDALTGREVWHYLVPNRCSRSNRRVNQLSLLGSDDLLQVAVGDTTAPFMDPKTGRVLSNGALRQALFFVSGNVGVAQDQSGSVLSGTGDNAKITVIGHDLADRTQAWRRPAPTCAQGQLVAVLGPPGRLSTGSWNVHPTPGSSNSVVDLPDNGFAMGYSCRLSQKTFVQHVWLVRPGGRDQDIDLGSAQFVDILPVPVLLSTPQGLLVQTRAGVRNIGPDGAVRWTSGHGKSDEIRNLLDLDDGSVLLRPGAGERNVVRLDAATGRELSSDPYYVPSAAQVRGHLVYDTDTGGVVEDALHPVARPKVFAAGVAHGLLEASVLPGVEVIGGQNQIVGIR